MAEPGPSEKTTHTRHKSSKKQQRQRAESQVPKVTLVEDKQHAKRDEEAAVTKMSRMSRMSKGSKRSKRRSTIHDIDMMQTRKTIIEQADDEMKTHKQKLLVGALAAVVLIASTAGLIAYLMPKATVDQRVAICDLPGCLLHGMTISRAIDYSADPCVDFYKYTCGKWQDAQESVIASQVADGVQRIIKDMEREDRRASAPETFYMSCINADKEQDKNLKVFLEFKRELGLVWPEKQPTDSLHPLDVMLNLAIRWDMNFLFDVGAVYSYRKPALLISLSYLDIGWKMRVEEPWTDREYRKLVRSHFSLMGVRPADVATSVEELRSIEDKILGVKRRSLLEGAKQEWFVASVLDSKTPSVPSGMWMELLVKHDHQFTWTASSMVIVEHVGILTGLEELLTAHADNKSTLIIGLTWIFIQTHLWAASGTTELRFRGNGEDLKKQACVYYVDDRLGVLSAFKMLKDRFGTSTGHVGSFMKRIKDKSKELINNLTWIEDDTKREAWLKVDHMTRIALPSYEFFDDKRREVLYAVFINQVGSNFMENLLTTSVMMRTLRNNSEFSELYSVRFLPRFGLSRYLYLPSTLQISISSLYPPLFYTSASLAVQYAAWGSIVSLGIMRAFDEKGTSVTHDGKQVHWWGPGSKSSAGYVERTSCKLGATANSTAAPVTLVPNVAALELTYAGFKDAVSSDFRDLVDFRIPHLDQFTDEQAFFLTYCYVQCSKKPLRNGDECNVPLKNFAHFGAAFKCAPNAPMNPANRCSFFNVARKPI